MRRLLGEHIDDASLARLVFAGVADRLEPVRELCPKVVGIAKRAPIEKRLFAFPERALDARLFIWTRRMTRVRFELVVGGKREKARVVDRLFALPVQDN